MKTKTILSIAIMAALPFGAHADPVGPAAVPANGTPVVATASAPYMTQTPTAADATHIASTAYVKGAYNDAIAAVNKVSEFSTETREILRTIDTDLNGRIDYEVERLNQTEGDNYNELLEQILDLRDNMDDKRVEIYTTWENDNAKQQVAFVNAQ